YRGPAAPAAWTASPAPPAAGLRVCARAGSDGSSVCRVPCCAAPSVTSLAGSFPGCARTVELPGDLAADRGRVALQRRGPDIGGTGFQPGHGGLGGSHPRRDLG